MGNPTPNTPLHITSDALTIEEQALAYYDDLLAQRIDWRQALRSAVAAFPAASSLLADYAIMLSAESQMPPANAGVTDPIGGVIDRIAQSRVMPDRQPVIASLLAIIRSRGLSQADLCLRLHIGRSVLTKLDRRVVNVESIPPAFLDALAFELNTAVDSLKTFLAGAPRLSRAADYNSDAAPRVSARKQDFAGALRGSVATGEIDALQLAHWLRIGREDKP